jgi:hypothetical protein
MEHRNRSTVALRPDEQWLANELVIFGMRADPDPQNAAIPFLDTQGPVMQTNARGKESTDPLEMQRRVCAIFLEEGE